MLATWHILPSSTCHETHRHMSPLVRTAVPVTRHIVTVRTSRHTDTWHCRYILLYLSQDTQTCVTVGMPCCICHKTRRHVALSVCPAVPVVRHTDTWCCHYILLYLSRDTQTPVTVGTSCCTCHKTLTHGTAVTSCCTCHKTLTHGTAGTSCCTCHKTLTHGTAGTSCCTCLRSSLNPTLPLSVARGNTQALGIFLSSKSLHRHNLALRRRDRGAAQVFFLQGST